MGLRKRSWLVKKAEKFDPVESIFGVFYRAVPELKRNKVGRFETGKNFKIVRGRIPGRYNADFEMEAYKDGSDVIVKIVMWGKVADGISYRVSIPVADKVAGKFGKWFREKLSEIRTGKV